MNVMAKTLLPWLEKRQSSIFRFWGAILAGLALSILVGCGQPRTAGGEQQGPWFESVPASVSGVHFVNRVIETYENNMLNNAYVYSGGGIAAGDVNNDGWVDLYFVSNLEQDRLYLNEGDWHFRDVTAQAGITHRGGWHAGVVMADVNGDGWLDIYVSRGGAVRDSALCTNLLFINQGDGTFREEAARRGLADASPSTQSVFFDYDRDGDLDCYVVNHPYQGFELPVELLRSLKFDPPAAHRYASDRLYRNDGTGHFTDVSEEAGISNWAYGLGVLATDLDLDGWPDVFVANDFEIEDFYYRNLGNGRFREILTQGFRHVSYSSMGVDVGDVNNDLLPDLFVTEMLPETHPRTQLNILPMPLRRFEALVGAGAHYQYMQNALHLNRGQGFFSEIAEYAGIEKTDWSWGTLWLDMDADGWQDIYVANGILRDMNDRDFTWNGNRLAAMKGGKLTLEEMLGLVPSTPVPNYAFRNRADFTFERVDTLWGLAHTGFSNSVVYADLDNDGDPDLVTGHLNEAPSLYRNLQAEKGAPFLCFRLEGPAGNPRGLNAKVYLYTDRGVQYREVLAVRGFQSACEPLAHFGLGTAKPLRLEVIWPDGRMQSLSDVPASGMHTLRYAEADAEWKGVEPPPTWLQECTPRLGLVHRHEERPFDDFAYENLLPHRFSQNGPDLAVGDLNGDGLDDLFVGGAAGQAAKVWLQTPEGRFVEKPQPALVADAAFEDMGAALFDFDGDGDLDLYVVSGSNEYLDQTEMYQDRLYLNDGQGLLRRAAAAVLPRIEASGSCVVPADFDGDGDWDLFVGGRVVPQRYPEPARSYLLRNERGRLVDATETLAKGLARAGLVTAAAWLDHDGDGDLDLWVAGEWMPLRVWENNGEEWIERTETLGFSRLTGWWYCLYPFDPDGDGDIDVLAGNMGLNYRFQPADATPLEAFYADFDGGGGGDVVLARWEEGKLYPVKGRDNLSERLKFIRNKYPSFAQFGAAQVAEIFGDKLKEALHLEARTFASCWLENAGEGQWVVHRLPPQAQWAPLMDVAEMDVDGDGRPEWLGVGNLYGTEVETPRMDAGLGVVLRWSGTELEAVPAALSGFYVPDDARAVAVGRVAGKGPVLWTVGSDGPLRAFCKLDD